MTLIFSSFSQALRNKANTWTCIACITIVSVAVSLPQACAETIAKENPSEATFNPTIKKDKQKAKKRVQKQDPIGLNMTEGPLEKRVEAILAEMTLEEKIGQLCQISSYGDTLPEELVSDLRAGWIGSLFYTGSAKQIAEAQRVAQEESRLGLPLLTPRDVIHGFRTVFPIPLGQAATWDVELTERAATVAATEAKAEGVNWTFAPMMDVARDARWGRIAESFGEDPKLSADLAAAMVRGFQLREEAADGTASYRGIAACAKHYVAYGLSEGGRDYNRSQVAISELHNVFLKPFHASVEADCLTFMSGFNTVNGVPSSGHEPLIRGVLKQDWGFDGLVVSDWGSVEEMIPHGYAADKKDAARLALNAGVDMEMATDTYRSHLKQLVADGQVEMAFLDDAVKRVLRVKLQVAVPRNAASNGKTLPSQDASVAQQIAREVATKSVVLLKNEDNILPLDHSKLSRIALIGPMIDAGRDQLGCWMLDGKAEEAVTLLSALRSELEGKSELQVEAVFDSSIDEQTDGIAKAVTAAEQSDVVVLAVGEGWELSGEARSRASIGLPGKQAELVVALAKTGKPIVTIIMAGRPLTIGETLKQSDALLYAWHPGTMGGPALVDLLVGRSNPSGKLPVTFPKHAGQLPLYYNHPRTGRPAVPGTKALIGSGLADFPGEQKYRSHYLDVDPFPQLVFGFGLSYTSFVYSDLELSNNTLNPSQTLGVRVRLTNTGSRAGEEIAQLYVQDTTATLVRPVRELKAYRRVALEPGESSLLEFAISADDLAYYDNTAKLIVEPGKFRLGVGGNSEVELAESFELIEATSPRQSALVD